MYERSVPTDSEMERCIALEKWGEMGGEAAKDTPILAEISCEKQTHAVERESLDG